MRKLLQRFCFWSSLFYNKKIGSIYIIWVILKWDLLNILIKSPTTYCQYVISRETIRFQWISLMILQTKNYVCPVKQGTKANEIFIRVTQRALVPLETAAFCKKKKQKKYLVIGGGRGKPSNKARQEGLCWIYLGMCNLLRKMVHQANEPETQYSFIW